LWVAAFEISQTLAQSNGIKLADSKRPEAALRATYAASQPIPALTRGLGQSGIYDLDQLMVGRGQGSTHT
jgi:hypothetical protein